MPAKKEKLIIIDGNALIHRSFHALPPTMATKNGQMVNAVYGFAAVLLKAIRDLSPDYIALALDRKAPTFRHEKYKEYKATRVKAPDELYEQIPFIKKIAEAFAIPIYEKDGYEADDLIGTIAAKVDGQIEKIIVTGDLDALQLINEHTKVYTMSRGLSDSVIYNKEAVKERFELGPEQMIDYKALRGDPSDNIPGVRGIGEKTATELLKKYGTLEKLYNYAEKESRDIKPRILALLLEHKKDALLSKSLATIKLDAPISFELEKSKFGNFNDENIIKLFSELEFKSLLPRIRDLKKAGEKSAAKEERQKTITDKFERNKKLFKYILVDDEKKFSAFFSKLKKEKEFAVDTETSGLDPLTSELLGISFSWKKGEAYYINAKCQTANRKNKELNLFNYADIPKKQISAAQPWLEKIKPILEDENIKKSGHNIKFDLRVLKNSGINLKGIKFDTMLASYLLSPGTRQHNLDAVAFSELGFEKISKDDLLGKGKDKLSFSELPAEKLSLYSCEDADFTFRLAGKLKNELKKNNIEKLFNNIEMPLVPILADMENNGIIIDKIFLSKLGGKIDEKIKNLEEKIKKLAGVDFNINSTQQLREVLFEKLEISTLVITKTKTGLSTAADELVKLKDQHPIIKHIQEYRELAKLANTYINALPELINKKTERLHASFNQAVTATGRLSSSEPNLQNIPVRGEWGKKIRKAFGTEKKYKLLSLDYSQIELRIAAHMSGDKKMIAAFKNNLDIHAATAAEINKVELSAVTSEMRREAKAINFGILYGQGPHGLSQTADIPYIRAKNFIDKYFDAYKDIKKYIDKSIISARKNGYTKTLFGRKRYLPEINSSIMQIRKGAERMAVNTPLQGTAADMIKIAMINVSRALNEYKIKPGAVRLLLQVHDELLFEVEENTVPEAVKIIKKIMENVIKLKVQIIVDAKIGANWGEMEKII
jgi:DNA polymerase-1